MVIAYLLNLSHFLSRKKHCDSRNILISYISFCRLGKTSNSKTADIYLNGIYVRVCIGELASFFCFSFLVLFNINAIHLCRPRQETDNNGFILKDVIQFENQLPAILHFRCIIIQTLYIFSIMFVVFVFSCDACKRLRENSVFCGSRRHQT